MNQHLKTTYFSRLLGFAPLVAVALAPLSASAEDDPTKEEPFYVNESTIYMKPEADADKAIGVTPVSQGVWAREFPDGYQFYDLHGAKFTDFRWDLPGVHATPRMTQWGMLVKKAGDKSDAPYYLVKPDGSIKAAPASWIYPTKFVDGLAIVRVKKGYEFEYRYINPDLQIVFPHLSPLQERFEDASYTTPPLSEGLRAYCTKVGYDNLWGYIDEKGKIVIEPQFREARSFHCGLALVKDKAGNKYFITPNGNKAFDPQWGPYDDVSDYDSGFCTAPGDRFDRTDYYDVLGNKVNTVSHGTPFHNGIAYCFIFDEGQNKNLVHRMNTGFSDMGAVGVTTGDFNPPSYDEAGVAHFNSWMVDGGPCNGSYFFDYTVGPFSKEGYAPATMVTNDGQTSYKGFVDRQGHFRLVYETHTKQRH